MLAPVDRGNDHRQWEDLIEYVSAYPGTRVLTDPVTGYVINAHTEARYGGYKFYGFGALNLLKQSFSEQDFRFYRDGLLIVNLRDGSLSTNGRLGNHWPDDVMHVSRYYGKAMLAFVDQEPRLFRLVWERDRIRVYEIASVTDGRSDA